MIAQTHPRARRFLIGAVSAAALVLAAASPAGAHANIDGQSVRDGEVRAAKGTPSMFSVSFDQAVSAGASSMALRSANGSIVSGAARLTSSGWSSTVSVTSRTALPKGRYALEFSVVSADGHPVTRAIGFGVGVSTPSATPRSLSMHGGGDATISGARVGQRTIRVNMPAGSTGGQVKLTCQRSGGAAKVRAPFIWDLGPSRGGVATASGYLPVACTYTVAVTAERSFPLFPVTWSGSVPIAG